MKNLYYLLTAIIFILQTTTIPAQWTKVVGGSIPADAFVANSGSGATKMYIARAKLGGGLHIGKVLNGWDKALIPYGGKEEWVGDYEVYVGAGKWVDYIVGSAFPTGAISGGNEANGTPLYIARATIENELTCGKARFAGTACIGKSGKENYLNSYQVLSSPASGYFRLKNKASGKYLAIGAGDPNQKHPIQWENSNQRDIVWVSDYQTIWNGQTDIPLRAKEPSDRQIWHEVVSCDEEKKNETWFFKPNGSLYTVTNTSNGRMMCVDGASNNNGANVVFAPVSATLNNSFLWSIEKVYVVAFRITVQTGGDDLRGGNNAYVRINGTSYKLNNGTGWGNNSTNTVNIAHSAWDETLISPTFEIVHDGNPRQGQPFDTYDNWNMDRIKVEAILNIGGTPITILDAEGIRFTGQIRKKSYELKNPFFRNPECIPG